MKDNPDYKNLIDLLAVYSESHARLSKMQAEINEEVLDTVDPRREEFAEIQAAASQAEEAIREIAGRNPQWFPEGAKTLKTPYGHIQSRASTSLAVPSEEATIRLIRAAGKETQFLRVNTTLDKEALEALKDDELAEFGIIREKGESLTIKPVALDMGKAVEAATKRAEKREKEAA